MKIAEIKTTEIEECLYKVHGHWTYSAVKALKFGQIGSREQSDLELLRAQILPFIAKRGAQMLMPYK